MGRTLLLFRMKHRRTSRLLPLLYSTDMAINRQYHQVIIREMFACEIQNPQKFCLWTHWNPGHWNPKYSSRNPEFHQQIGIQNPGSTVKDWNSVPEILNQRRGIQNPRDQDCLGIPFEGRHIFYFHWLIFNSSTNVKKLLNKEYKPRCNNALLLCQKIVHKLDEYIYIYAPGMSFEGKKYDSELYS